MFEFLPNKINVVLNNYLNLDTLYELRLRTNKPISVNYNGKYYFLSEKGMTKNCNLAISITAKELEEIIYNIGEYSLYAINDQIKEGYIVTPNGLRIGIAGECVYENDKIVTIKNFTSLNIRIPHEIIGSSDFIFSHILAEENILNTIILSPPGAGKTTILRDLSRNISSKFNSNILIIDERNEISASGSAGSLNVGNTADIIKFSDKQFAFLSGIRTLRPDVIITDELASSKDVFAVENAILSGVKVVCSAHSDNIDNFYKNSIFKDMIDNNVFDRYVVLSTSFGMGTVENIYDKELEEIVYRN